MTHQRLWTLLFAVLWTVSTGNLALAAGGGIGLFTLDPPPVIVKIRQGAQIQSLFLANWLFEVLDFVVLCCFHTSVVLLAEAALISSL